jgi:hypothetical protein
MENNPIYTDLSKEEIYRPEFNPSMDTFAYNSLHDSIMNIRQNNYNLFQGKKSNLDFFSNVDKGLSDYSMPEYFSPTKENYDRFASSPDFPTLGFSIGRDNEDLYGKFQTTGEKIANGFSQMWDLTKYQFVDQLQGWGRLFDFNPVGEDIEEVNKRMDEIMNKNPIFMTEQDRNSTFNWSKFSNIIGQTGFTLGMAGEILFEEAVLTAVNVASAGALTPLQSARTAQLFSKAASVMSRRLGNTIREINKVNNTILDVNTARNIYQRMAAKGAEFLPFTNTIQFAAKGAKQGENLLQVTGRGFGSFYRDLREANAVFTEARAEASGTKEEVKQQLYEDYLARNNREPSAQEMEKFEKISDEAMNANFISNSIIIGASNRIMFDNLLRGFKGVNRYIGEAGDILNDSKGYFSKGFNFRSAKAIAKTAPLTYFKNNITEAIQENLQSSSNNAVKSWYTSNYFDPNSKSVYASIKDGLKSQMSQEGLDTFLAGFLTGSIAGPIQGGSMWAINRIGTTKDQRVQRKTNLQDRVDKLNEFFTFNDKTNLSKQVSLANAMYDAAKSGSKKDFYDIKDETLRSLVRAGIETNKLDSLFDNLEENVKNLSEEEFKEAYPDIDKKDLISSISEVKERANTIKNIKEELDYKYPTDYSNTGFANTKSYEEAKWHVVFMQDSANRIKQRVSSLRNEISSFPELGQIPFSDFELLYKKDNLEKEIKALSEQNKIAPDKNISKRLRFLEILSERGLTPALYKAFLNSYGRPVSLETASESFEKIIDITRLSEDEAKVFENLDFIANPMNWKKFLEEHKNVQEELAETEGVRENLTTAEKRFYTRIKRDETYIPEIEEINGQRVRAKKIDLYQKLLSEKGVVENNNVSVDKLYQIMTQVFDKSEINEDEKSVEFNEEERKYAEERRKFHFGKVVRINQLKKEIELAKEKGTYDTAVEKEVINNAEEFASDPEVAALIEEYFDQIAANRLEFKPELGTIEASKNEILSEFPNYEIETQEEEVEVPAEVVIEETQKLEEELSKDSDPVFTPVQPVVNDLDKKADIERRRQEELKGEDYRIAVSEEIFEGDDIDNEDEKIRLKIVTNKDGSRTLFIGSKGNLFGEGGGESWKAADRISKDNTLTNSEYINAAWKGVGENFKTEGSNSVNKKNKAIDDINAKYDTELAALEKTESKPELTEQEALEIERDDILKKLNEELSEAEKLLEELEVKETKEEKEQVQEAVTSITETLENEEKEVVEEVFQENNTGQTKEEFVAEAVKEELIGKPSDLKGEKSLLDKFKAIIKKIVGILLLTSLFYTTATPVSDFLARNNIVSREKTQFIIGLTGGEGRLTEKSFSESNLSFIDKLVKTAESKGRNYVDYTDYPSGATGVRQKTSEKEGDEIFNTSDENIVKRTLGRFNFEKKDGKVIIKDQYNFNDKEDKGFFESVGEVIEDFKDGTKSTYQKVRKVATLFGQKEGEGSKVEIAIPEKSPETKLGLGLFGLGILGAIRKKKENNEPLTDDDIQQLKDRIKELKAKIKEVEEEYTKRIAEIAAQKYETPKQPVEKEPVEKLTLPESGLIFKVTPSISAYWIRDSFKWEFYNKSGRLVTSRKETSRYSEKFSKKVSSWFNTWWNSLLSEEKRNEAKTYFSDYYYMLQDGMNSEAEGLDIDTFILRAIKGVRFKPTFMKDLTDVSETSVWFSKDGYNLDTFVTDGFLEELISEGYRLEEDEVIDLIKRNIEAYPKGISNKKLDELIKDNLPQKRLLNLKDDFQDVFGLDIDELLLAVEENDLLNLIKETQDETETQDEGQPEEPESFESVEESKKVSPPRKEDLIPVTNTNRIQLTTIKDDIAIPYHFEGAKSTDLTILNLKNSNFRVNEKGEPDINGKPIDGLPIEDYSFFTSEFIRLVFRNELTENYKFMIFKDDPNFWKHYNSASYSGPKFEKGTYNYDGERKGLVIFITDKNGTPIYVDKSLKETTSDKGALVSFFLPSDKTSEEIKQKRQLIFQALSSKPSLELINPSLSDGGWEMRLPEDAENTYDLLKETNNNFSLAYDYITVAGKGVAIPEINLAFAKIPLYVNLLKDGLKYEGQIFDILGLFGQKIDFEAFPEYIEARKNAKGEVMKDIIRNRIIKSLSNILPAKVELIDDTIFFNNQNADKWTLNFRAKLIKDLYPFEVYHLKDGKIESSKVAYSRLFLENSKIRIIPLKGKKRTLSLHSNKLSFELLLGEEPIKKRLPGDIFNRVVQYLENQNIITEKICK